MLPEFLLTGTLPPAEAIDDIWDRTATQKMVRGMLEAVVPGGESIGRSTLSMLLRRFALPHLGAETNAILAETWVAYDLLDRDLPLESNTGAIITTHLAVLTLALHRTLLAKGRSEAESHELIHAIGWDIYNRMADPPFEFARTITADPVKRLRIATDVFRRFPFGPPGYSWRDVQAGADVVAFDCTRCPVAEFFAGHESAALCTATWCALDYPVAEKWGGRLVRPKTIAGGNSHCDFRWHATRPSADTEMSGQVEGDLG